MNDFVGGPAIRDVGHPNGLPDFARLCQKKRLVPRGIDPFLPWLALFRWVLPIDTGDKRFILFNVIVPQPA